MRLSQRHAALGRAGASTARIGIALVAVLTTLAAAEPAIAATARTRQVLLVGNVFDGTVSIIDARALRVISTLDVTPDGKTPRDPVQAAAYPTLISRNGVNYVQGLAISPGGRTLYVSRGYLGDTAAFELKSGRMLWRTEIAGLRSDHIGLSPDGRRLFVSALTANEVQVLDTRSGSIIGSFPTGDWPHVIEFSRDGSRVYVGSLGNQLLPSGLDGRHWLTVADAGSLHVLRNYSFDAGVRPFVFTADETVAFVQLSYLNGFVELDLTTGQIVKTVQLPVTGPGAQMKTSDYPNQAAHHGIALSPDGKTICDAGTISSYAAMISVQTLAPTRIIPIGDQPAEAVTSIDGRYCFLADRGPASNSVSVVSYKRQREVARIPVGQHPQEEELATIPAQLLPPPPPREHGHIREHRARQSRRAVGMP